MQKIRVAILDFGSEKLRALVGEPGVNKTFVIKGSAEVAYSGFYEGEFLEPDELASAISEAIEAVKASSRMEIEKLYVGVPGEFVTGVLKEKSISFPKKRKITDEDIEDLYKSAYDIKTDKYVPVNRSAVYFVLSDNRKVVEPIGLQSDRLGGYLSFILADKYFINTVTPLILGLGIKTVEYISSTFAECMYLFEPEVRDRYALLADVGYLTGTVALVRGDGILYHKSFSFGGGRITADLSHYLGIDFDLAEMLKRKVNVSIGAKPGSVYEVMRGTDVITFPTAKVNEIVKNALDNLCELIDECLTKCPCKYPDYLILNLTGGGVSYMRGSKEYMAKRLNKVVEIIAPDIPNLNKPTQSSELAVLNFALKQNEQKTGFLKKIFG